MAVVSSDVEMPGKDVELDVPEAAGEDQYGDMSVHGHRRGMRITFQDLEYVVVNSQNKKEKISLLHGVSGFFNPGQMSALMGPSGSGKTTLLDVLAGRKTVGEIRGDIKFGGTAPNTMFLRRFTGYVEQFDTLLDILTVKEMLLYTAELKRPMAESYAEKEAAVNELIEQLGLGQCKNVRIGNALARGISGGQAKRVNIGIALVTNPRVLFLDEPTSGLDSYTSNEVMTVVKALVKQGITICATIHSPTPYAFHLFDRVIMLLRGRVVFFGERGPGIIDYFKKQCPDVPTMSQGSNEAEWIVDLTTHADRQGRGGEFADAYEKSDLRQRNLEQLQDMVKQGSVLKQKTVEDLKVTRATVTPFWWALKTLIKYRTTRNYRNPEFLGPRIGDKLIFSLLIMTLYWKIGDDYSSSNILNIAAVLFMWTTLPAFGAASYIPSIVLERPLFIRERNDGLYRTVTYLCAKMLDELMLAIGASLIFSCVVYFGVKLQGEWLLFWLTYLTTLSCGIVLAYWIAAASPNMDVANAALPTYVVTLLFFAGFLLRFDDMPNYWKWYSYIDFLRWGWSAQMANQFGDQEVLYNGQNVLDYFSVNGDKWGYLGYESLFFFVFFMFALLTLAFVNHSRR